MTVPRSMRSTMSANMLQTVEQNFSQRLRAALNSEGLICKVPPEPTRTTSLNYLSAHPESKFGRGQCPALFTVPWKRQ